MRHQHSRLSSGSSGYSAFQAAEEIPSPLRLSPSVSFLCPPPTAALSG